MTAADIATAPRTGNWILGYVPDLSEAGYVPWIALTWDDAGWVDDAGNACSPTLWTAMPDPQPNPTGWSPPEGVIHIEEITGEGWKINGKPATVPYRWSVYILRLDGSYDEYREFHHYAAYEQAEERAVKFQKQLGLNIAVTLLDPKIIPFSRGRIQ